MTADQLCDELAMIDDEIVRIANAEPTYRGCNKARELQYERAEVIDKLRGVGAIVTPFPFSLKAVA